MDSKYKSPEKVIQGMSWPGGSFKPFASTNCCTNENNNPIVEPKLVIDLRKEVSDLTVRLLKIRGQRESALTKNVKMQEDHLLSLKRMQDVNASLERENTVLRKQNVDTLARLEDLEHEVEKVRCQKTDFRLRMDNTAKDSLAKDEKINELNQIIKNSKKRKLPDEFRPPKKACTTVADRGEKKVNVEPTPSTSKKNKPPPVRQKRRARPDRKNTTCKKCGVTFHTMALLIAHNKLTECPPVYECGECDLKFKSEKIRNQHVKWQHSEDVLCEPCNKIFDTLGMYIAHKTHVHGRPSRFKCQYCSKYTGSAKSQAIHQRVCKKNPNRTAIVAYTEEQKQMFEDEIESLIQHKLHLDSAFQNYVPERVFYMDNKSIGFRPLEENDEQHHLYYIDYTPESQKEGLPVGQFETSSNLSLYPWAMAQLKRSRDERDPIPDQEPDQESKKKERRTHCEHTSTSTLDGLKTNWMSTRIVLTCTKGDAAKKIKYYANSMCDVSNLVGTTAGKSDPTFWEDGAREQVDAMLTSANVPFRVNF